MSLKEHIQECALESGVDPDEFASNEDFFKYKDHLIEVWYDETTSSPMAWNAFIKGFGTYSEYGRERVVHVAKRKIDGLC